jgi:hypothetical protein
VIQIGKQIWRVKEASERSPIHSIFDKFVIARWYTAKIELLVKGRDGRVRKKIAKIGGGPGV